MHPVSRQHFHDTDPGKDTSRQRIKGTNGDNRRGIVSLERIQHTNTNGHTDGSDERKGDAHYALLQVRCSSFGKLGDASTQRDALEHLVEEDNNEERNEERVTCDHESDTDDDGVENDTSLQIHDVDLLFHWGCLVDSAVGMGQAMAAIELILGRRRACRGCSLVAAICRSGGDLAVGGSVLLLAPLYKACAEVVCQERQEKTSKEDSSSCTFILELAKTLVAEHKVGVGEEMYECSGKHDTGAELLEEYEDDVRLGDDVEASRQNGQKDTKGAGRQDDEEKTNAQRNVVVTGRGITRDFVLTPTYAVPR